MNTTAMVFLMVITSSGVTETPNPFASMRECVAISVKLKLDGVTSYCVEKRPVNIEKEMMQFITLFRKFQREMDSQQ